MAVTSNNVHVQVVAAGVLVKPGFWATGTFCLLAVLHTAHTIQQEVREAMAIGWLLHNSQFSRLADLCDVECLEDDDAEVIGEGGHTLKANPAHF
jgi:hypothetical protein